MASSSPPPVSDASRTIRVALVLAVGAACVFTVSPVRAAASDFRRLDGNAMAFATDGTRYAIWQYKPRAPIIVYDTRTRHRGEIESACELEAGGGAAARFLVRCEQRQALLDVRTGHLTPLPGGGEQGPTWNAVGTRYLAGYTGAATRCRGARRGEPCTAIYGIASGGVTYVPESQLRDLDRRGAPLVCARLRRRQRRLEAAGDYESFDYRAGTLAVAEPVGLVESRRLRIEDCRGGATVLHALNPRDLELSGGLLTWDTGSDASNLDQEEQEGASSFRGRLMSYRLSTRARRSWTLPTLPINVNGGSPSEPTNFGTYGYSAHTDYAVFWIAQRTLRCGEKSCGGTATSYVYVASL